MNRDGLNPYRAPETFSVGRGHARFRLRRWFAVLLYLALFFDLFLIWSFGMRPFLVSIPIFMLVLVISLFTRRDASIQFDETGVEYRDLVQLVELSWDRVVHVVSKRGKTLIKSDYPLAQITVSQRHEDHDLILDAISQRRQEFDFQLIDRRRIGDDE